MAKAQKTSERQRFLLALETFCLPLSPAEHDQLLKDAQSDQPGLFAGFDPETLRRLARSRGLVEDTYAAEPTFFRLVSPIKEIPMAARKALGLVSALQHRRESIEQMVLTTNPAKVIDRAARGVDWHTDPSQEPTYADRDGLRVDYREEGMTISQLNERVLAMDPRTADAWRLITARSLEGWTSHESEPSSVWIDVRDLADAMGYKKKQNGAYDPKALEKVARGITDLERMFLTLPLGTMEFPIDPKTRKRKKTYLEAERTYRVLAVMGRDDVRDLFGERYPLRWLLRLGPWAKAYPREFAPIFGNLVQLSVKGSDLWAKNIGMELIYHYQGVRFAHSRDVANLQGVRATQGRDGRSKGDVILKVKTLLERASLMGELEEMRRSRNARRAREYFEKAMDTLAERSALLTWRYHPDDEPFLETLAPGRNTGLDEWLEARVEITPPTFSAPPEVIEQAN